MKPLNNRSILVAYYKFSFYLVLCVLLALIMIGSYYQTAAAEFSCVRLKTEEYEHIYLTQMESISQLDSIYNFMLLPGRVSGINEFMLRNVIAKRRNSMLVRLEKLEKGDFLLQKRLLENLDVFMSMRDSVRRLDVQEGLLKYDLKRCMDKKHATDLKVFVRKDSLLFNR